MASVSSGWISFRHAIRAAAYAECGPIRHHQLLVCGIILGTMWAAILSAISCRASEGPITIEIKPSTDLLGRASNELTVTIENVAAKQTRGGSRGKIVFIPKSSLADCLRVSGVEIDSSQSQVVMETVDWDTAKGGIDTLKNFLLVADIGQVALSSRDAALTPLAAVCKLEYAALKVPSSAASAAELALAFGQRLDQAIGGFNDEVARNTLGRVIRESGGDAASGGVTLQPGHRYVFRLVTRKVADTYLIYCRLRYGYLDYDISQGPEMLNSLVVLKNRYDTERMLTGSSSAINVVSSEAEDWCPEGASNEEVDRIRNATAETKPEPSPEPPKPSDHTRLSVYVHEADDLDTGIGNATVIVYKGSWDDNVEWGDSTEDTASRLAQTGEKAVSGTTLNGEFRGFVQFDEIGFGSYTIVVNHEEYKTWVGRADLRKSDYGNLVYAPLKPAESQPPSEPEPLPEPEPTPEPQPEPSPSTTGLLDLVLCIDKSGSMIDDLEIVQQEVDKILGELDTLAKKEDISLQVGLVLFQLPGEANVFEVRPLTEDIDSVRQFIKNLNPRDINLADDEDLYAAMMYAMNEEVDGKRIDMGWRHDAAKIAIPITDEAPKDAPFTLEDVSTTAFNLDPVHVYPLLMPKTPLSWLDPAVRSMNELASATGGEAVQVESAEKLPDAIIAAVKLAIRRHREEIWRKENPPYVLYGVGAGIGVVLVLGLAVLLVRGMGRVSAAEVALTSANARLTGRTDGTTGAERQD